MEQERNRFEALTKQGIFEQGYQGYQGWHEQTCWRYSKSVLLKRPRP